MFIISTRQIRSFEFGLLFRNGEFQRLLPPGRHWFLDPLGQLRVDVASRRDPWLVHPDLDLIVKSGVLTGRAEVLDLKDHERALVWIDGRFARVVKPGQHALWTGCREFRIERVTIERGRFVHPELHAIRKSPGVAEVLDFMEVAEGHEALYFLDGEYVETLPPGLYAFWKGEGRWNLMVQDRRETVIDISGQELMTADKVSLRLNAVLTCRVSDSLKAVTVTDNVQLALYRDAQLALRAVVGARELDSFLTDREAVAADLEREVRRRAEEFGVTLVSLGIRDVILPGEMKELLGQVTQAKKAAEANLITRREETAAMRSQANTAKLLENNPALLRLREIEALQAIAGHAKLSVFLGEKGLTDRVMNLI